MYNVYIASKRKRHRIKRKQKPRPNLMLHKLLVLACRTHHSQLHVCCSKGMLYYRVSSSTGCTLHECHIISQSMIASINQLFHKDHQSLIHIQQKKQTQKHDSVNSFLS